MLAPLEPVGHRCRCRPVELFTNLDGTWGSRGCGGKAVAQRPAGCDYASVTLPEVSD